MIVDSKERYGSVSKAFHWLMAVLIGWQLFKFGDRIAEGEHWVGQTLARMLHRAGQTLPDLRLGEDIGATGLRLAIS